MKILPLSLLGLSYANNVYKFCDIHRETVSVGRQATTISSPEYPASFPVQTQCKWIIKAQGSGNVKLEFEDWSVPSSPDGGCRVMFISILDSAGSDIVTSDTQKKGVNLCGNNPGTFISAGSEIELIIHSDSHPSGAIDQRLFQARVSSTNEAPTPANPGMNYSQGAIDRRFGAPKPRAPVAPAAMPGHYPTQQRMPQYPQPPAMGPGMPRQRPHGANMMPPPRMGHRPTPPGFNLKMADPLGYERPVYEPAFTRAPELPAPAVGGAPRPNARRVNPLSGIIPKNHAKKPGATREDVHGRVNTKLISKMQQLRKSGQLNGYINKLKQPEVPTGPGVLAPGALPPPQPPMMNQGSPQVGGVYGQNGQISQNPILLKHLGNQPEAPLQQPITPAPTAPAEDNENMNLVIMIGIGTGVITLVSIVIVLLFYIHKRVKKQEFQEHQITTQKYMFDHTVLSRGSTLAAEGRKEPVDKPRDFMDEDDVEMVRAVCRAPSERRPKPSSQAGFSSRSSDSSKDSGIDGSSSARTKSYVTSLKS